MNELERYMGTDPEQFITERAAEGRAVLTFPAQDVPELFSRKVELDHWTLVPVLSLELKCREVLALPKSSRARAIYKEGQPRRIQRLTGCDLTWANRYMNRARGTTHAMQDSVIIAVHWICTHHWLAVASMNVERVRAHFGNISGMSRVRIQSALQIAHLMQAGIFYYAKARPRASKEVKLEYVRVKPGVYRQLSTAH